MELINVEAQIKNSNSALLKKLPQIIISGLAKITYQDEINRILTKYEDAVGIDFLPQILDELNIQVEIEGLENLPESGKCFFCVQSSVWNSRWINPNTYNCCKIWRF